LVDLAVNSRRGRAAESRAAWPDRDPGSAEKADKSLWRSYFALPIDAAPKRPISSFARPGGFVIRWPLRTRPHCSSVAQR
jgi:hypothetical protein